MYSTKYWIGYKKRRCLRLPFCGWTAQVVRWNLGGCKDKIYCKDTIRIAVTIKICFFGFHFTASVSCFYCQAMTRTDMPGDFDLKISDVRRSCLLTFIIHPNAQLQIYYLCCLTVSLRASALTNNKDQVIFKPLYNKLASRYFRFTCLDSNLSSVSSSLILILT